MNPRPILAALTLAVVLVVTTCTGANLLGCTPGDRRVAADVTAALAPVLCALVPVFDGPDLAAVLCQDAAKVVSAALNATVRVGEHKAPACVMVPLGQGEPRQLVCAHRRGDVERALAKGAVK